MTASTLIIGFGNLLMGDDGAGIHLVRKLEAYSLPAGVEVLDGGVNSFAALMEIRDAVKVIFIDAMQGGGKPGDIYRLNLDDIEEQSSRGVLSIHDFSLLDSLYLYKQTEKLPPVTIYGIEPAKAELGIELSPAVADAVDTVILKILDEISGKLD